MEKVIALNKRSKKEQKAFYSAQRCRVGGHMNLGVRDMDGGYKRGQEKKLIRIMIKENITLHYCEDGAIWINSDSDQIGVEKKVEKEENIEYIIALAQFLKVDLGDIVNVLTEDQLEQAYRRRERFYRLKDAEDHLRDYFDDSAEVYIDDDGTEVNIEMLCSKDSKYYVLEYHVDWFEDRFDCNRPENDVWNEIIREWYKEVQR